MDRLIRSELLLFGIVGLEFSGVYPFRGELARRSAGSYSVGLVFALLKIYRARWRRRRERSLSLEKLW